jgi:DNA (cytosine-5)-methyltransferase 1
MRPRGLDICCGAGGCSKGYTDAGFDMYGVDNEPHSDYPYPFRLGDGIAVLLDLLCGFPIDFRGEVLELSDFAFIHVSSPCHDFTPLVSLSGEDDTGGLLPRFRWLMQQTGLPYVIENVVGAPLRYPVMLCGSEFGLGANCRDGEYRYLKRHRLFESNVPLMGAGGCRHRGQPVGVYGTGGGGQMTRGYKAHPEEAREAMGIDWMARKDICQAVPPAMTAFIGEQVLEHLTLERVA